MAKPVRKNVGELDVVDWGADYFGVDPSSANIQDVINKAPDGSRIGFEEGRYLLEAPLYYVDKTLHFYARGKVELVQGFAEGFTPMIHAERADHSEFVGFDFIGADTPAYYIVNYASFVGGGYNDASAIRITNSADTFISRCTVKQKHCGFAYVQCVRNHSEHLHVYGMGQQIADAGGISNFHVGYSYLQGEQNQGYHQVAENTGNGLLFGSSLAGVGVINPENVKLFGPIVLDSHDNGIYISSGREIEIHAPYIKGVNSSGIRIQGDDISVIGGWIEDAGAGIGITGLSTNPIHNGIYASHNVTIIGTTIEAPRSWGILIDDKSNSLVFTDDVKISGVTIRGSLGDGIFGTADNVNISDSHISDTTRRGIYLLGRGNIPNPKNQVINNVTFSRTTLESIRVDGIKDSLITNVRDCDGNANAFNVLNTVNTDFINLRSSSGRLVESSSSSGNLIANVVGPNPNTSSGSAHRQWLIEP